MECRRKMSSFYLDGVVSGPEPLGSHAIPVRMPNVTVTDAFVDVVSEFGPEVRAKSMHGEYGVLSCEMQSVGPSVKHFSKQVACSR